jgi:hypothetical protein
MSPVDPRELKKAARTYVDVIESDRLCGKCRYNLRGLPTNGRCPECGHPIRGGGGRGFRRFSDNLAQAPLFYLKTLAFGSWLLALSGVSLTVCFWVTRQTWDLGWAVGSGVASVLWWVGVFIVTGQRAFSENTLRDEVLDGPYLRNINRLAHVAWVLVAAAYVVVNRAPLGSPMEHYARLAAWALSLVGMAGVVTLGLQLASLSDWAGDTNLGERFRITAWIMGAAILLTLIASMVSRLPGLLTGFLGTLSMLVLIVGCIALLFFDWALLQLAGLATWAINNNVTADKTERRMLTARERRDQEMADRSAVAIALQDAAPPSALGVDTKAQTAFESNVVKRRQGGADPYALEPDPPAAQTPKA